MRVQDLAQLSTRMFKTNPLRTWLTILGMGVGTGAVVVLVGLGFGLQKIILEQIVFGDSLLSLGVSASGSAKELQLTPETVQEIEENELVVDAAPLARFPALVTYKGLTGNVFIQGVEPPYLRFAGVTAEAGEAFTDEDAGDTNTIMLSPAVLKLFGVADDEMDSFIGEKVSFRLLVPSETNPEDVSEIVIEKEYTVRGITKEQGVLNVMMMLPELRNYVGIDKYERIQVNVIDNEALPVVEKWLVEEKKFRVTALSKTVEQASKIFQGIQAVLAVFGGIALVVSAIGMFNTMTVTLLERTKEIGIMRTIGAAPNDVKYLFVSESIVVGFLGGITGILMGVVLGFTVNVLLNWLAKSQGGQAVSLFSFPFDFLLFIALFSAAVGYLTGIFPASRASKLNPLDAIRYE
ncbi:MAG: ABC transporter permease [Candidatus Kaiserbacteria bacterium]|nr:ABC transporter permease [Candidatus Kaiserbacteria bacterium]MCB9815939.1 ABC transporter permease [Candidatus Nomurabacteria bacterium]